MDGSPMLAGKAVSGFSNSEGAAVQLAEGLPLLLEDELKAKGAIHSRGDGWSPYAVTDGNLITGQNPASSQPAEKALLHNLNR